ncbi:MAG: von Willebrand factor type A domain-containing protein, partial [Bacteroidota bacterium]
MKKLPIILFLGIALSLTSCYSEAALYSIAGDESGLEGENYNEIVENPFVQVSDEPISTFSIDADGGSYSNARRFIEQYNELPPVNAIRTEEFINYFPFDYPQPAANAPIGLNGEVSDCPWETGHKLVRIGIQGKDIPRAEQPPSNFVLLIDVSGSMKSNDKLDLLQTAFNLFVDEMREDDRLAIVTYAGSDKVVLESTAGSKKSKIKRGINKLSSGGGTNGAQGIITAYEIAEQNFIQGGNNRIILGSDGDFNIGISDQDELIELIEEKRESGVFLSVLGVGSGNLNEGMMEQLANN